MAAIWPAFLGLKQACTRYGIHHLHTACVCTHARATASMVSTSRVHTTHMHTHVTAHVCADVPCMRACMCTYCGSHHLRSGGSLCACGLALHVVMNISTPSACSSEDAAFVMIVMVITGRGEGSGEWEIVPNRLRCTVERPWTWTCKGRRRGEKWEKERLCGWELKSILARS